MATRLIEPDELEKVLRPILTDESCPLHIAAEIDMNIDLMPKVDAVPVVRCRDCRFSQRINEWIYYCYMWNCDKVFNQYCDMGERKDGEHETD